MCHNSGVESEQQIERYVAYGMPEKAIKKVKYTLRKREQKKQQQQQHDNESCRSNTNSSDEASEEEQLTQTNFNSSHNNDTTNMQETVDTASKSNSDNSSSCASDVLMPSAENATTAAITATTAALNTVTSHSEMFKIPKLCGRFRKMQEQQQQQQNTATTTTTTTAAAATATAATSTATAQQQRKLSSMEPSMDDALAVGTQITRQIAERIYCLVAKLQNSRLYTILTRTTQPAHLIAICILSFVLLIVGPDLIENNTSPAHMASSPSTPTTTTPATASATATETTKDTNNWVNLFYLGAFAIHFGSQVWMTFVSVHAYRLSLYFSLPRHTFGQCQQILFPKYFALNAILSISMLIIFVKYFLSTWSTPACVQLGILALTAAIEVVVRLYLAPPMLRLMHEKYKIEGAIGSGQEVGSLVQGDLVQCPHYQRIHKAFRRIHMTIAIGNMLVLLATCLQLYFLASKIRIS